MQEELIDQEAVADGRRRLFTIFGVLITILLLGLLLYYVNCTRPVEQFKTLYEQEQYEEAYALYSGTLTRIRGNARKAELSVEETVKQHWLDYQHASISQEVMETTWNAAAQYTALTDFLAGLEAEVHALYNSRTAYEDGLQKLKDGAYMEAMDSFARMSEDDVLYSKGLENADIAVEHYCTELVSRTDAMMEEAAYEEAMTAITDGLEQFPERTVLTKQKEKISNAHKAYTKQVTLAQAQELLNQSNLEETLRILTGLQQMYPEDTEISNFTAQYETAYCEQILRQAQPLFDQGLYAEALAVLQPAYEILPNNEGIAGLYDQTAGYLPAWLWDFPSENESLRGTKKREESSCDTHGNSYGHVMLYAEPSALSMQTMVYTEGRENYSLKKKYTRLFGTLAVKEGSRGIQNGRTGTFRIYGDGNLLYETGDISELSDPVSFDVNVSGIDVLSFTFQSGTGLKYLLGDVCIYKTYPEPQTR